MILGWGGLALLIFFFEVPPLVWARWGFFALWFIALTGTALPVVYFLNLRFSPDPPTEFERHCSSGNVGWILWRHTCLASTRTPDYAVGMDGSGGRIDCH